MDSLGALLIMLSIIAAFAVGLQLGWKLRDDESDKEWMHYQAFLDERRRGLSKGFRDIRG